MNGFEPIFSEYEPDKLPIASHHKIYIYILYIYKIKLIKVISSMVERLFYTQKVIGSTPISLIKIINL